MGLFSIFPESVTWIETWITRVFVSRNSYAEQITSS